MTRDEESAVTASTAPPNARVRAMVEVPILGGRHNATFITFEGLIDTAEHIAIGIGNWHTDPVLVRIHSECLTGDVFGSQRCDCGPQLDEALNWIASGGGLLLYLRQEGRGIGLYAKLDSYLLQNAGLDTFAANEALGYKRDLRDFTVAAQMLRALEREHVTLISNNPQKERALRQNGIDIVERRETGVFVTPHNHAYLWAKRVRDGHNIALEE